MTLFRSLLQGIGWRLGKEVAKDALRELTEGDATAAPPAPVESPAARAKREAREEREAERAVAAAKAAAEKKRAEDERAVEQELAGLKKKLARGK